MSGEPKESGGTGETVDAWTAEAARKQWAELLSKVQYAGERIPITRSGKRAAIVVPPDWHDRAEAALAAQDAAAKPTKRA
jgi:prevent-host-death family protein